MQVYRRIKINQPCLLCTAAAGAPLPLCGDCETELPWLTHQCLRCALPLPTAGVLCANCQRRAPAFERVEAALRYAFPVDVMLTRFKHQGQWPLGRLLGELLARHLEHAYAQGLPRPERLLPVPLSRRRLRQRGFNQAQMLAGWLGQALQLPCDTRSLQRLIDTPPQQGLDARARRRNLRQAFALNPTPALAGAHLALVDDVLTTGSTADSLARLLLRAGAGRVDVYCVARTPAPGD